VEQGRNAQHGLKIKEKIGDGHKVDRRTETPDRSQNFGQNGQNNKDGEVPL
jgi:hypothetical protein